MKTWSVLALCCALALCGRAAAQDKGMMLLGKWELKTKVGDKELNILVNFEKDNRFALKVSGPGVTPLTQDGTYKLVDDTTVEVEITHMGQTKKEKSTFAVTKDTLELTDSRGKIDKFTRAK
jgi:uncharacterized protein (TIGR03066 family)